MTLSLSISRPKSPKGLSYVMKTSWLTETLDSIAFDGEISLNYYTPRLDNVSHCMLIRAEYWLPNINVDHDRFYITSGVCQSQKRKKMETIVKDVVIPLLVDWMVEVKGLPDNSPKKAGRHFWAEDINDELKIHIC